MKTLATLEPLTTKLLEIQRINSAASVLSWDQETYMPKEVADALKKSGHWQGEKP